MLGAGVVEISDCASVVDEVENKFILYFNELQPAGSGCVTHKLVGSDELPENWHRIFRESWTTTS